MIGLTRRYGRRRTTARKRTSIPECGMTVRACVWRSGRCGVLDPGLDQRCRLLQQLGPPYRT